MLQIREPEERGVVQSPVGSQVTVSGCTPSHLYVVYPVLVGVSIAVKTSQPRQLLQMGTFNCGCLLTVHYHGGEHGGVQEDMVLEKELRALYLTGNRKSTGNHTEGSFSK